MIGEENKVGSSCNPISIGDEEDGVQELLKRKEAARMRSMIQHATMTGSRFELCIAVIKTGDFFKNKPNVERERIVNKAILDYFKDKIGININIQHFEKRPEPKYDEQGTKPNACEFILYGTDFMTTKSIKKYFMAQNCKLKSIKWINDSTCRLFFANEEEARIALESKIKFPQQKVNIDIDDLQKQWFSLKPSSILHFDRELMMRYATNKDIESDPQDIQSKPNKNKIFQEALRELQVFLLKKFEAVDRYIQVRQSIMRQQRWMDRRKGGGFRDRSRQMKSFLQDQDKSQERSGIRSKTSRSQNGLNSSTHRSGYSRQNRHSQKTAYFEQLDKDLEEYRIQGAIQKPNENNDSILGKKQLNIENQMIIQQAKESFLEEVLQNVLIQIPDQDENNLPPQIKDIQVIEKIDLENEKQHLIKEILDQINGSTTSRQLQSQGKSMLQERSNKDQKNERTTIENTRKAQTLANSQKESNDQKKIIAEEDQDGY